MYFVSSLRVGNPLYIDIVYITRINHQLPQHFLRSTAFGLPMLMLLDPDSPEGLVGELEGVLDVDFCFFPRLMP